MPSFFAFYLIYNIIGNVGQVKAQAFLPAKQPVSLLFTPQNNEKKDHRQQKIVRLFAISSFFP
jgi:hypothetical protein